MGDKKETAAKNFQIRLSANALRNFDEITGYIAFIAQSPQNAIKVGDKIFETIDRIKQHPLAYKECEELQTISKIYRRAVCSSWIIIFRVIKNDILILGILHSSRKPSATKLLRKVK